MWLIKNGRIVSIFTFALGKKIFYAWYIFDRIVFSYFRISRIHRSTLTFVHQCILHRSRYPMLYERHARLTEIPIDERAWEKERRNKEISKDFIPDKNRGKKRGICSRYFRNVTSISPANNVFRSLVRDWSRERNALRPKVYDASLRRRIAGRGTIFPLNRNRWRHLWDLACAMAVPNSCSSIVGVVWQAGRSRLIIVVTAIYRRVPVIVRD